MEIIVITSCGPAHAQAKLLYVNAYVHTIAVLLGNVKAAQRAAAVYTKMKAHCACVFVVVKALVLMQIFTSQLPASFAADIWLFVCLVQLENDAAYTSNQRIYWPPTSRVGIFCLSSITRPSR